MQTPPTELDGAKVLFYALLKQGHRATGNTRHYRDGGLVQGLSALAICRYDNEIGFYLFYCDDNWDVVTDTYHDTLGQAKDQGEFEYQGIGDAWTQTSSKADLESNGTKES